MTVAVLPLAMVSVPLSVSSDRAFRFRGIHCSKSQNTSHNEFHPARHVEIPHNEDRKETKRPVGDGVEHRRRIGGIHDDLRVDASLPGDCPPRGDWSALQECQKQIEETEHDGAQRHESKNPDVDLANGDSKEEASNGNFENTCCDDHEDLTEPPEL